MTLIYKPPYNAYCARWPLGVSVMRWCWIILRRMTSAIAEAARAGCGYIDPSYSVMHVVVLTIMGICMKLSYRDHQNIF